MGEVVNAMPRPLYPPDKKPDTHCTEGRVVPRDGRVKFRPPLAFDPWTVKSVSSRYNDWAIAAHLHNKVRCLIFNLLTSNVNYSGRTAPLTSKVAFYIFIQQI